MSNDLSASLCCSSVSGRQFQTIECAFAGKSGTTIPLAPSVFIFNISLFAYGRRQWVFMKQLAVVEILVTEGQSYDPPGDQLLTPTFNTSRIAVVNKTLFVLPVRNAGQ
jgi:hypothetical protein